MTTIVRGPPKTSFRAPSYRYLHVKSRKLYPLSNCETFRAEMLSASSKSIRSEKILILMNRSAVILWMYSDNTFIINSEDNLGGQMRVESLSSIWYIERVIWKLMKQDFSHLNLGQWITQETVASGQLYRRQSIYIQLNLDFVVWRDVSWKFLYFLTTLTIMVFRHYNGAYCDLSTYC
jgi:hypothetical protein